MRIPNWFKRWLVRYGFDRDRGDAGWRHALSLQSWHRGDEKRREWINAIERITYRSYRKGRRDEKKWAVKIIDALEAEIKQNYIDEIITACSGGDGLLDSACTNSRAIGLRKLAEWGIVTIEQDYGRRVIARLVEAEKNGGRIMGKDELLQKENEENLGRVCQDVFAAVLALPQEYRERVLVGALLLFGITPAEIIERMDPKRVK